ncbi:MAG: hypothetical protein WCW13_04775 [archaeon]|jgi:hypothetical protein
MAPRQLRPIRPGDNRFVYLNLRNHHPDNLYATRRNKNGVVVERKRTLRGTKTFVYEDGRLKNTDLTRENFDFYLPNRGNVRDNSLRRFIKTAMDRGVKVRVGGRVRGKKEELKWDRLWNGCVRTEKALEKEYTYKNYKAHLQVWCEWSKLRHKIIKRELSRGLKDGSVESIYGFNHIALAADLKKAGIHVNTEIEVMPINWFEKIMRKVEQRIPIKEADYKRGFVSRLVKPGFDRYRPSVESAISWVMISKVSEEVLDKMIASPKNATNILLAANGVTALEPKERAQQLTDYWNRQSYWKSFYEKHYLKRK